MSPIFFLTLLFLLWFVVVGYVVLRGRRRGRVWLVTARIMLIHLLAILAAGLLLIDKGPSVVTPLMTTSDKISLRNSVVTSDDAAVHQLILDGVLIDRGLRTAADLIGVECHCQVAFEDDDRGKIELSIGLPIAGYLNVLAEGRLSVSDGDPDLDLSLLQVGHVAFPALLSRPAGRLIAEGVRTAPLTGRAIATTRRAAIRDARLELDLLRQTNLSGELMSTFQSAEAMETSRVAWRAVQRWLEQTESSEEAFFVTTTRDLFHFTRELAPDWPATRQNEAALIAGGIALGHPSLAQLAGLPVDRGPLWQRRHQLAGQARLYNRGDLVQHFWVSAALTQLTSLRISDSVGLAKEEMDSGPGGSGFSFADLLANRAGLRFALLATDSEATAKEIQRRVAEKWTIEELVPPIDGLPEGISEAVLEQKFGGVSGRRFADLEAEIERRLSSRPMLQDLEVLP